MLYRAYMTVSLSEIKTNNLPYPLRLSLLYLLGAMELACMVTNSKLSLLANLNLYHQILSGLHILIFMRRLSIINFKKPSRKKQRTTN